MNQVNIIPESVVLVGEPDNAAISRPRINSAAIELAGKARGWLDGVRKMPTIMGADEHASAVALRKTLGTARRQLDDIAKTHTAPYRGAIEALRGFFRGPEENIADAIKLIDAAILTFEQAEERRRREEAEKLRKAQAEEAARARAEADRLAREQAEREAKIRAEAAALEEAGKVDAAAELEERAAAESLELTDQIMQAAVTAEVLESAPVAQAPELARGGTQRRKVMLGQVANKREFVQAWMDGIIPDEAVLVNEKLLGQQVRSLGKSLKWPGVLITESTRIAG